MLSIKENLTRFSDSTVVDTSFTFHLYYKSLEIGQLKFNKDHWIFNYSDQFKKQSALKPLFEFPDTNKIYENKILWPFFESRIPSPQQPEVKKAILKEGLDEKNVVELLKRFGERTISNPYELSFEN